MTWKDFQQVVIGGDDVSEAAAPSKNGKKQRKHDKVVPAGVDAIADFRGWADRIRNDETDMPPEIKGILREDRAKCRVILRGLFGVYTF